MLLLKITKILKMSNFASLENIITEIQSLILKMNSGKLQLEELESLNSLTRELNERIVILKYKAYEEKVFGVSSKAEVEKQTASGKEFQDVISEMSDFLSNDSVKQNQQLAEEKIEEKIEEKEIPQVAEADDEPIFGFDLFEHNTPESFAPTVKIEKDSLPEEYAPSNVNPEPVIESYMSNDTANKDAEEMEAENSEEIVENQPDLVAQEAEVEMEQEEIEGEIDPEPEFIQSEDITSVTQEDVFKNFQRLDSGSRLMSPKIHSLIGAFGLNEKLQCIRELYNGSSESFNQSIEKVDNQTNFDDAKKILSENAISNSWDLESNLVNEFLQKVERRFL